MPWTTFHRGCHPGCDPQCMELYVKVRVVTGLLGNFPIQQKESLLLLQVNLFNFILKNNPFYWWRRKKFFCQNEQSNRSEMSARWDQIIVYWKYIVLKTILDHYKKKLNTIPVPPNCEYTQCCNCTTYMLTSWPMVSVLVSHLWSSEFESNCVESHQEF